MSNIDVVRAWKDEQYRMSLSETERASLPENPDGMVDLTELDLEGVSGGGCGSEISIARTSCCCASTVATACCG
ncbi:mersacidin/lichenicidin family type 2 lantibiotic [Archangium sp.]|uniref:mersacidin/lichenicidin family type 2 lantibiotic n=1 Tax=Archangium sp. TaxID=1872627 RepID=UPI00389ACE72